MSTCICHTDSDAAKHIEHYYIKHHERKQDDNNVNDANYEHKQHLYSEFELKQLKVLRSNILDAVYFAGICSSTSL